MDGGGHWGLHCSWLSPLLSLGIGSLGGGSLSWGQQGLSLCQSINKKKIMCCVMYGCHMEKYWTESRKSELA